GGGRREGAARRDGGRPPEIPARRRPRGPRRRSDPGGVGTASRHFSRQPVLQYGSGPKEFVLDGPEGHVLDAGDLFVGQAREVPQRDQLPEVRRELLDRAADGLASLDVPELAERVEP